MLKKLRSAIKKYEKDICKALASDLGKREFEGFICEVDLAQTEIIYLIKHTKRFAAKH